MPESDPTILVDLTTASTALEAEIIRSALEAEGVPAFAATSVGTWMQWDIASTMPMRVQVRRQDLAAAQAALATIRADAQSIDWDAEELGQAEPGDSAAAGPGTPGWKQRYHDRRTVAQTFIWLASIAWSPVLAVVLVLGVLGRFIWKPRVTDESR